MAMAMLRGQGAFSRAAFRSFATTARPTDPKLHAKFVEAAKAMVKPAIAQRQASLDHVGTQAITNSEFKLTHEDDWTHTEHRENITSPEVQLAKRCHGNHLELLKSDETSIGSHYQLIHYDVPNIDEKTYSFDLHGLVDKPATFTMDQIRALPSLTEPVMMACAGTGRMMQHNRLWTHVPWGPDSIGCSRWTGCSLADFLQAAGLQKDAKQVVFTGHDKGVEGNQVQHFERCLDIDQAMLGNCMLAYEMNGQPLPAAHGFPLRLIVPGWYGMASVKWIKSIEVTNGSWWGYQMDAYSFKTENKGSPVPGRYEGGDDEMVPVRHLNVRALMAPPGYPEFFSRLRVVEPGTQKVMGKAWSGAIEVERVEFSSDGGRTWAVTELESKNGPFGWQTWSIDWEAPEEGNHVLMCRAFDKEGREQDKAQDGGENFNTGAFALTHPQRVLVKVDKNIATPGEAVDTVPYARAARRALWEEDSKACMTETERDALYHEPGSQ